MGLWSIFQYPAGVIEKKFCNFLPRDDTGRHFDFTTFFSMVTGLAAVKRVHFCRLRSIEVGNWHRERVLLRKREIAESKMAALQLRAFLYYYVEPRF